jgi:type II secretion system protein N
MANTAMGTAQISMDNQPSRAVRGLKVAGWSVIFLFFLAIFTLTRLSDDPRIRGYVSGMIASILAPQGIGFSSEESSISVGFGISYDMKQVTLSFPSQSEPVKIERVVFSPSLIAMIFGKIGGDFSVEQGKSELSGTFAVKGANASVHLNFDEVDLGKMGILLAAAKIRGSGIVEGKANLEGNFAEPGTLAGNVKLKIKQLVIEPQSTQVQTSMGPFTIKISQRLNISESDIDLEIDKSKAVARTLRLGKAGSADDIKATATGDVTLGRNWDSTSLNLRTTFSFSDAIRKDFFLLDPLLKNGKQPDGSYSYGFTGPIHAVVANPPIGG